MTVGAPTVDANGVESYVVTSTFQGPQSMTVRVLEPTSPAAGQPHRLLYVLPVLWVSGDQGLYTADMVQLDSQLTAASIPHTFVAGGSRAHSWDSGWLQGAVTALDAVSIVRRNGQPSGVLASGVTQTTISLNTDQKATCRFGTSAGVPYASLPYLFATTGGTSHSTLVTGLTNGAIYSFFVRCQDSLGNSNPEDFSIVFSVANPGDTTPPVRSNGQPTGVLAAGTTQTNLSLATNENATCRYATVAGTAYASMVNTFSTTGGTAHSTTVSGLVSGGTYSYYVRCQDASGNANPDDFTITFTTAISDPASSSFVGTENPLSEGGMWNTPGAWASMAKNNGAYGAATNMAGLARPMVSAGQFSEITFDQNLGSASWVGVTTRVQSASNGSCYLAIAYNGGVWLYRVDDTGTLNWTQLAGANVDITVAPRDLRLESQGANHRVYFNGVQLISYTESVAVYTTGQPGVAVYQNASTAKILDVHGRLVERLRLRPAHHATGTIQRAAQWCAHSGNDADQPEFGYR